MSFVATFVCPIHVRRGLWFSYKQNLKLSQIKLVSSFILDFFLLQQKISETLDFKIIIVVNSQILCWTEHKKGEFVSKLFDFEVSKKKSVSILTRFWI